MISQLKMPRLPSLAAPLLAPRRLLLDNGLAEVAEVKGIERVRQGRAEWVGGASDG